MTSGMRGTNRWDAPCSPRRPRRRSGRRCWRRCRRCTAAASRTRPPGDPRWPFRWRSNSSWVRHVPWTNQSNRCLSFVFLTSTKRSNERLSRVQDWSHQMRIWEWDKGSLRYRFAPTNMKRTWNKWWSDCPLRSVQSQSGPLGNTTVVSWRGLKQLPGLVGE